MELYNSALEVRVDANRLLHNYVFPHWNNLNAKKKYIMLFHIFEMWSEAHALLIELHQSILNFFFSFLGAR
jgi:hypothetical protein